MSPSDETNADSIDESPNIENDDGPVNALLEVFHTSMMIALPSQNLQLAEENYTKAFAISEHLKSQYVNEKDPDELIYLDFADLIYFQIALVKTLLSNIVFMAEQRIDKAKACLLDIKDYSEKSMSLYAKLSKSEINNGNELGLILNVCVLNAKFFKHLSDYQSFDLDLSTKLKDDKYVDELGEREKAIAVLRKYFEEPWTDYNNEVYHMHSAMVKRLIDIQERRLEALKQELSKVSYVRPKGNEVFIVHGHDEAIFLELKLMLKETFNINPIILKDETDDGSTLIEKFEKYAIRTSFVFVLLTPDDFVSKGNKDYYQGRPNVLFELGWFFGRLGRNKVRILKKKDTAVPSDLAGIVTLDFNERIEEIFRKINSSLEVAGIIEKA